MKIQVQKSIVSKPSEVKKIISLLPMAKKMLNSKIKGIMRMKNTASEPSKIKNIISLLPMAKKMLSSRIKVQNTPIRVSNRGIKSLENNFSVNATKNIINTPKIVIEKSPIVAKPNVVTSSKIATKPKKVSKLKIVDKPKIVIEKKYPNYDEYKNRVIKQLKHRFDTKKESGYIDDDDKEYKGIRNLEYMFNEVSENNEDYYKLEIVGYACKSNYRVYESRGSQYYESLEEYLIKIRPYLENMIRE